MNSTRSWPVAGGIDSPRWRPRVNAKGAWAILTAGVLSYEITCREGQLLSQGVDEWLISRPILTRAAIVAMALHLGNAVPTRYDVVSLGFQMLRQSSRFLVMDRLAS
jgi:hypothetical protein